MKEENNSSACVWITVTVGVILLYLLSPGPVMLFYQKKHSKTPNWFQHVYGPLILLCQHSSTVDRFYHAYHKAIGVTYK